MKVFLSWSQEPSKKVADVLKEWLPLVLQQIRPYISSDIDKGTRWNENLNDELKESKYGIIILTKTNITAPWICFEAGALSNSLEAENVSPFYFDVAPSDLSGSPLSQFQATMNTKEDILKLLFSLNKKFKAENQMPEETLSITFEMWWPKLEEKLQEIAQEAVKVNTPRKIKSVQEMALEETLNNTRNILRILNETNEDDNHYISYNKSNFFGEVTTPYAKGATRKSLTKKDLMQISEARYRKGYVHGAAHTIYSIESKLSKSDRNRLYSWLQDDLDKWLFKSNLSYDFEEAPGINLNVKD